ncbi:hypothetical protein [Roseibium sp. RKSG952]|uniref:hypothetical protein n=1 Tax=Roseibium sp. RKSG952 TaxID=2529384 RepID=UPI0012BC4E16|nr:hypothetical protein [Roseibium sp. RKSG952]MTH95836.1 hypothetical protein [Roseibium sp. RKSG952]
MKFTLPITFEDGYVPKGARNSRPCLSHGSVEIEIVEVDRVEAPIIHIVGNIKPDIPMTSRTMNDFTGTFRAEGNFTSEVVLYEGEYYSSLFDVEEMEDRIREENRLNPFYGEGSYAGLALGPKGTKIGVYKNIERRDIEAGKTEIRKWIENYDTAASLVTGRARDLIIVDGKVHTKVGEPVLSIAYAGIGSQKCVLVVGEAIKSSARNFGGDLGNDDFNTLRFGLDEIDLARSFLSRENGIDCTVIKHVSADMVTFRNDDRRLFNAAKYALSRTRNFVPTSNREFAFVWNRLHMALRPGRLSQQSISAIRDFLECCAGKIAEYQKGADVVYGTSGWSLSETSFDDTVTSLVEALKAWDDRADSDLDWMDSSMGFESRIDGGLLFREVTNARDLYRVSRSMGGDNRLADAVLSGDGFAILIEDKAGPYALARATSTPDGGYEICEMQSKIARYEERFRKMIEAMLPEDDAVLSVDMTAMGGVMC